jgi:ribosome-associated protein
LAYDLRLGPGCGFRSAQVFFTGAGLRRRPALRFGANSRKGGRRPGGCAPAGLGIPPHPAQRRLGDGDSRARASDRDGPGDNGDDFDQDPTQDEKEKTITRRTTNKAPSASLKLLKLVEKSLDDDKAEDVVVIPLMGKTDIADFMVVATGSSQRHIGALAQHLRERIKSKIARDPLVEGEGPRDWVLVDVGDVIVHLFRAETRAFYALEKLWMDAPARAQAV